MGFFGCNLAYMVVRICPPPLIGIGFKGIWKLGATSVVTVALVNTSQIREQMSGPEISWYEKSILDCGLWSGLDCEIKGSGLEFVTGGVELLKAILHLFYGIGCVGRGWAVLKKVWADYEQLLRPVFSLFRGQKIFFFENTIASAL